MCAFYFCFFFFFQAEDGIRDADVTGVQTCALPILEKKHQAGVPVELELQEGERLIHEGLAQAAPEHIDMLEELLVALAEPGTTRSEERRVGKECRYRGAADDEKEKKRVGSEGIET